MSFKIMLQEDMDIFFSEEEFGEPATYNGKSIVLVENTVSELAVSVPGIILPSVSVLIKASDVARPKEGDIVVYKNQTWQVVPGFTKDGEIWSVTLDGELENQMVGL